MEVSHATIKHASNLLAHLVQFHEDEGALGAQIIDDISALLDGGEWYKQIGVATKIRPYASWFYKSYPIGLLELKNTLGIGGDAMYKVIVDYTKIIATEEFKLLQGACNFPVVLLAISGACLQVSAVVFAGSVYVTSLLTLDISSGLHASQNILRLPRVFTALSKGFTELRDYYAKIFVSTVIDISAVYPNPTLASGSNSNTSLPKLNLP
ncbi:hypothetical protein HYPSUDRAFT_319166 [Hypholoma sublateritium FD-334 SS-4]|uniref:Uncharacterized protein n=1 Tax=Hypholoma sublateritium (strain FD-334 SS-4) TaxID=945553 RepID=A0A0D2LFG5_HYPSF|nr:hypothetical protein HYPSUDRAFT_319166 [Hypholoma sublateritium FD-334 SS-4]